MKIYRVHYNWFTISDRGEYYFHYTLGEEYLIPGMFWKRDEVEEISVDGDLIQGNAVATVSFKGGAVIQQDNISTIVTIPEDYGTKPEEKKDS